MKTSRDGGWNTRPDDTSPHFRLIKGEVPDGVLANKVARKRRPTALHRGTQSTKKEDMATRHLTLRIDPDTFERLEKQSRQAGITRSHLAKTLLEEGLRMEAHPGIVFCSGPAGRRAGLANGPDVWEVMRLVLGCEEPRDEAASLAAEVMGLHPSQVMTALHYYVDYPQEIDA